MAAGYQFLPWVRRGLAAVVGQTETLGPLPARATVSAGVVISNVPSNPDGSPPEVSLRLYGPGDVLGIDPRLIVRLDPRGNAANVEPNYFVAIEFDPPDFPWMFTPAAPDGSGRLRPWLVLLVLDVVAVGLPRMEVGRPLPIIKVPASASGTELPDLSESWAWAHTQVAADEPGNAVVAASLAAQPSLNISRLMSPRRLMPNRRYAACLVPAFGVGVQRGLGATPSADAQLGPAWSSPVPGDVLLPVYFHWEFTTGAEGDFESLARKLVPIICPDDVGQTRMDLSVAGDWLEVPADAASGAPLDFKDQAVHVQGALRNRNLGPQALAEVPEFLRDGLRRRLNAPSDIEQSGTNELTPPLGPPIYGEWPALRHTVGEDVPPWLAELNLDPRQRVAASLGADVVRANQEDFMQSAWEQVGKVLEANRLLNRAKLSMEASASLHRRHVVPLPADHMVQLAAPAHARVLNGASGETVRSAIGRTSLPDSTMDGAMRRLTSGQRPLFKGLMRRASVDLAPARAFRSGLVASLAAGRADADPRRFSADGLSGVRGLEAPLAVAADGTVSLEAAGLSRLPAAFVDGMRSDQVALANRDFQSSPLQLLPRSDLATTGFVTQAHVDALREGARLAAADPTLARVDVPAILRQLVQNAGAIGDNATVLVAAKSGVDLGIVRADPASRSVSVTFLGSGQTTRVAELAPEIAAGLDAATMKANVVALNVLPIAQGAQSIAVIGAGAGGTFQFTGAAAVAVDNHLAASSVQVIRARSVAVSRPVSASLVGSVAAASQVATVAHGGAASSSSTVKAPANLPPALTPPAVAPPPPPASAPLTGKIIPPLVRGAQAAGQFEQALQRLVDTERIGVIAQRPVPVAFDLAGAATLLKDRLDPRKVVPLRLDGLIRSANGQGLAALAGRSLEDAGISLTSQQDRILVGPELPVATYQYVARLDKERFLPGIGRLTEPHLITLVETNPQFVEAFLVGMNREMNNEMLWREYPTDRRGTPFQRFWPWADGGGDIPAIHSWEKTASLGGTARQEGQGGQIVLLLRGELLRRYPNTVVYAWRAVRENKKLKLMDLEGQGDSSIRNNVREAVFTGFFDPEFVFVGLRLLDTELDDPGWYIVLQEQPTEPRFGFDEPADGAALSSPTKWSDATWGHTGVAPGQYLRINDANNTLRNLQLEGATFARNGAHLARITLQSRFRLTIHSSHLDKARLPPV